MTNGWKEFWINLGNCIAIGVGLGVAFGIFSILLLIGIKIVAATTLTTVIVTSVTWPIVGAGAALTAASVSITIIVKQLKKADEEPYKWLLPIMGIFAAFTIDILKDIIVNMRPHEPNKTAETIITAAVAGTTALIYFAGGFLWQFENSKKASIFTKAIAILFFLLPLICTYVYYISYHSNEELYRLIVDLHFEVIAPVCLFLVLFIVTLILGYKYKK